MIGERECKAAVFVFCCVLVHTTLASSFDLSFTITCTQFDSNGNCTEWTQKGKAKASTTCFPGNSLVMTPQGKKQMSQVEVGDFVLGYDRHKSKAVFTKVTAWLHRNADLEDAHFVRLSSGSGGSISLSGEHNVAVWAKQNTIDFVFAEDVVANTHDLVSVDVPNPSPSQSTSSVVPFTTTTQTSTVLSSSVVSEKGIFAPLTETSNLFVVDPSNENNDNNKQQNTKMFLAHSFAAISSPTTFESALQTAFWMYPFQNTKQPNGAYVHPLARSLWWMFPMATVHDEVNTVIEINRKMKAIGGQISTNDLILHFDLLPLVCGIAQQKMNSKNKS